MYKFIYIMNGIDFFRKLVRGLTFFFFKAESGLNNSKVMAENECKIHSELVHLNIVPYAYSWSQKSSQVLV